MLLNSPKHNELAVRRLLICRSKSILSFSLSYVYYDTSFEFFLSSQGIRVISFVVPSRKDLSLCVVCYIGIVNTQGCFLRVFMKTPFRGRNVFQQRTSNAFLDSNVPFAFHRSDVSLRYRVCQRVVAH